MSTQSPAARPKRQKTFSPAKRPASTIKTFTPYIRKKNRGVESDVLSTPRSSSKSFSPAKKPASKTKTFTPYIRNQAARELHGPATAEWQQYGAANYAGPEHPEFAPAEATPPVPTMPSFRGATYPDDYYGFVKASSIYVEAFCSRPPGRTQMTPAIKLVFGNTGIESAPFPLVYDSYRKCRIAHIVLFAETGQVGNRNLDKIPWPIDRMPTDLLDEVKIELAAGGPQMIRQVKITLNRESVLDVFWNHPRTIREHIGLDLTDFIRDHRMHRLRHTADYFGNSKIYQSPVLRQAALEWGKAWNPKYGGEWHKKEGGAWKNWPEEWCSEFASWVIRHATNLQSPAGPSDNVTMARYFIGRQKDSDLVGQNHFISPNTEICLWDDTSIFVGTNWDDDNIPDSYLDYREQFHEERKIWLTYYSPRNNQQCSWSSLQKTIKPGYYVKLKRGTRGKEEIGHSTLFVAWQHSIGKKHNFLGLYEWGEDDLKPGFKKERSTNFFTGLGGNQDNIIHLKSYSISKNDNDADILWKASRHAIGWGGYQDGFGEIGIQLKKRYSLFLKSKKNREVQ